MFGQSSLQQPNGSSSGARPRLSFMQQPIHISNFMSNSVARSDNVKRFTATKSLEPLPTTRIDLATFKGLKFIVLDGLIETTRDIYDKISGTFKWEMCASQNDHCIQYIREQCADKLVFFVASGSLGKDVVPIIHDLPQVYAIYIYCADVQFHLRWSNKYSKIRVVCNDDNQDLLPQFAADIAQADVNWGDALFQQNQRDKAKAKYEKALNNLINYTVNPNQMIITSIRSKLRECQ